MDFPQFNIARAELKELRRGPMNQHFHVDVALIDRSQHHGVFPQVFQLKNDYRMRPISWMRSAASCPTFIGMPLR